MIPNLNYLEEIPFCSNCLQALWMGTAGLYISDGKNGVLIDPYVSRHSIPRVFLGMKLPPRRDLIKSWARRCANPGIDAVLVSHSHFDHALDAPFFAAEAGAPLLGSSSTAMTGRGYGLDDSHIRKVEPGEAAVFGDFKVTFLESEHGPAIRNRIPYPGVIKEPLVPPAPATSYCLGTTFSLLIEHPLGHLVHHGSAGQKEGMYDDISCDIIFPGIAGRGRGTREYVEKVIVASGAKIAVPVHYDNFFRPLDRPMKGVPGLKLREFMGTMKELAPGMDIRFPVFGKNASLPQV